MSVLNYFLHMTSFLCTVQDLHGQHVCLLSANTHNTLTASEEALNAQAATYYRFKFLDSVSANCLFFERPPALLDVRLERQDWIEFLKDNWVQHQFGHCQVVIDDTRSYTKDAITTEGRKLLTDPGSLQAELFNLTSKEEFFKKTGLHLYVIAGRHTTLAQQQRWEEACSKNKAFDMNLLRRPTSVYKLSSLGVDGVSCLALVDNKLNEITARQVDTGT